MLCALTIRTLKRGHAEQLEAIAPFVESVGADGLYEIVEEFTTSPSNTG